VTGSASGGRAARLRLWVACLLLLNASCASFPQVEREQANAVPAAVRIEGARGPLTRSQSAAIIASLKGESGETPDILEQHIAVEQAVAGRPLTTGNRVRLLEDGPATYQAMFEAIHAARDHINLETYIYEDDEVGRKFADALLAKQSQGVQVHLIYDSVGSIRTPPEFFARLREGGIRVLEFNPVNPVTAKKGWRINNRDHRKLLVVDGRIAFIGGINISDVYSSGSSATRAAGPDRKKTNWRDTHASIEGPVVAEFQKLFLETWERGTGEAMPARSYFPRLKPLGKDVVRPLASVAEEAASPIYRTFVSAVDSAEQHVYMTLAYFIPDPQSLEVLKRAAGRGVDVKLILPSHTDFWAVFHAGRSYYDELLAAGVGLYERRGALLHSKSVLIDGVWSTVGSSNWDPRSFLHNNELNAVILGRDFAQEMRAMFEKDLASSDRIELEQWRRRPALDRVKETFARMWEYWL
jgi:cardiolipin synthase